MSVTELYEQKIKGLSSSDRLRLASLILNGLVPSRSLDESTEWTAEDLHEATRSSLARLDRESGEDNAQAW
jgi:hypothetical protein